MRKDLSLQQTLKSLFIFGAAIAILTGCAATSPPARYYTLNSLISPQPNSENASWRGITIGIGPISIPDYLDRPNIVTRTDENELKFSDFNKWAGSLKGDISRVISEDLSALLLTDHTYIYPWKSSVAPVYQITINIMRFDGMPDRSASLKAQWSIYGVEGKDLISRNRSSYNEQISGHGYSPLIEAKNRLLSNLSRDIASAIKSISQPGGSI